MGQESFVYSFVARGTVVLAEYSEITGKFAAVAEQCLQKLPSSSNKFIYQYDQHTFNYLVADGYAYCVVANESVRQPISIALLERIRSDFLRKYSAGKADTAVAKSLSKEFGPLMKEQMKYVTEHTEEIDKLSKVQAQVTQVQNIMRENIDKTIQRGAAIDDLSNKAEDLRDNAKEFKKRGEQIKRKMWYQNMKIKLVVFGILILLALIIWLSICRGFNCSN
ncbi:vesicle-associated membrane protein 724-like [Primulina huaijiensis]|uniref:vesicle-associated membrane protein 724-like n=1 Tax=Primulina huaijiensis TaxID=1492673 RepID=UPI003CC7051C